MKIEELPIGTRIYYTGDMANQDGHGLVSAWKSDRFGDFVDVTLEDGRVFQTVPVSGVADRYEGHCGTRFVTEAAWKAHKDAVLAGMVARASTDRKTETKVVRDALKHAGIRAIVGHGRGTAYGWLHIKLDASVVGVDQEVERRAISVAQQATGRHGNYDGHINVYWK